MLISNTPFCGYDIKYACFIFTISFRVSYSFSHSLFVDISQAFSQIGLFVVNGWSLSSERSQLRLAYKWDYNISSVSYNVRIPLSIQSNEKNADQYIIIIRILLRDRPIKSLNSKAFRSWTCNLIFEISLEFNCT